MQLLLLLVRRVLAAPRAELGPGELVLSLLLVLGGAVVPLFADLALERDDGSVARHGYPFSSPMLKSPRPGLNWRPRPYQGRALPTELQGHIPFRSTLP